MKKLYLDAILSPATANALAVPGSSRVLNCYLPREEKARIVRLHKWDNLMVDIEHDMRSVGVVQRTWLDANGAIWGRIHVQDERGRRYVQSLQERGMLPQISLTVCYAGDGLPANTIFNPISASALNEFLEDRGGAAITKYEARAVSLVETADVPFSAASAITFASADGNGARLGETYAFNHSTCVIKEMSNTEATKEKTPAPDATKEKPADTASAVEDLDAPWLTRRQAAGFLSATKARVDELEKRTAAYALARDVLNDPEIELNEKQRKRLIDFTVDPVNSSNFGHVQLFLEDFAPPEADAAEKADATPGEESEPEKKKRKINEAQSSIKKPMPPPKKEKKEEAESKVKLSPEMAEIMKSLKINDSVFSGKNFDPADFQASLSDMTSRISRPK